MKVATFDPNVAIAHYKFTYDGTINGTHRAYRDLQRHLDQPVRRVEARIQPLLIR